METTPEERLVAQKKDLVERLLKAFNAQFGTEYQAADTGILFSRPDPNAILTLTIYTKRTSDYLNIRFNITEVGDRTDFGPFHLQVQKNHGSGTLLDEVQVTTGSISSKEFPDVFNYRNSREYRTYLTTKPRILTMSGQALCLSQGNPIETAR